MCVCESVGKTDSMYYKLFFLYYKLLTVFVISRNHGEFNVIVRFFLFQIFYNQHNLF